MDLWPAAKALLEPLGYEVLELTVSGKGNSQRLLLRIDRLDGDVVSMEDISQVTEIFGLELDRLDPLTTPYSLEVESPGPKRPLFTAKHFARFHDLKAKVKTKNKTFTGIIRDVSEDRVTFEVDGDMQVLPLSAIERANLAQWPDTPR